MTLRPRNHCRACRSIWHPRGSDLSARCPRCGSADVGTGDGTAEKNAADLSAPGPRHCVVCLHHWEASAGGVGHCPSCGSVEGVGRGLLRLTCAVCGRCWSPGDGSTHCPDCGAVP